MSVCSKSSLSPGQALTTPLKRGSVVLHVIDRIKEALINGELNPGDFIPSEAELTRNLGVGKSSVREAIKMLQAMGVLDVRRGQGTRIREFPSEDALNPMVFQMILANGITQDIFDLRKMFEPAYTLMAMERASEEDFVCMQKTVEDFEEALRKNVHNARHDLAFHLAVLHATHNPLVIRIGETMMDIFEASIETSMRTLPDIALKDHKAILKAMREQDRTGVLAAIQTSFKSWETCLTYR